MKNFTFSRLASVFLFAITAQSNFSFASELNAPKKIILTYQDLRDYYVKESHGSIVENPALGLLLNQYLNPITDLKKEDLIFQLNPETRVATSLNAVSSHSINSLFVVDPIRYAQWRNAPDFVSAKKAHFSKATFDAKLFAYDKQFIHLADWNSLDHPPVMDLGPDLSVWSHEFAHAKAVENSNFFKPEFHHAVDQLSDSELSFGNQLQLLENGQSYELKLKEISNARESVLISVMSFFCDRSSERLENLLIQKAKEGVEVRLIAEKVWTLIAMKKCYINLKSHGVDVVLANDLTQKKEQRALFHNKFMIIDHRLAIIGGMNFIKNDNVSTGFNQLNKDEDVLIRGPLVADLLEGFTRLYRRYRTKGLPLHEQKAKELKAEALKAGVRGEANYETLLADPTQRMNGACRFVIQSPGTDRHRLSKVFAEYMSQAQSHVYIKNGPYDFKIDETDPSTPVTWNMKIFDAIFDRVDHHGVKLTTLGNGADAGSAEYSGLIRYRLKEIQSRFAPLEKLLLNTLDQKLKLNGVKTNRPFLTAIGSHANAESWEHFQYLHSKVFQIDSVVSSISSFNLELWSAEKSHESGILCMDQKLNEQVARSFLRDLVNSTPTKAEKP